VGNWFSKLFTSNPDPAEVDREVERLRGLLKSRAPLSEEDANRRKKQFVTAISDAVRAYDYNERLRLAERLVEFDPMFAYGWKAKVSALEALGRKRDARLAKAVALKILGESI
jgi:hypothetical protein